MELATELYGSLIRCKLQTPAMLEFPVTTVSLLSDTLVRFDQDQSITISRRRSWSQGPNSESSRSYFEFTVEANFEHEGEVKRKIAREELEQNFRQRFREAYSALEQFTEFERSAYQVNVESYVDIEPWLRIGISRTVEGKWGSIVALKHSCGTAKLMTGDPQILAELLRAIDTR